MVFFKIIDIFSSNRVVFVLLGTSKNKLKFAVTRYYKKTFKNAYNKKELNFQNIYTLFDNIFL